MYICIQCDFNRHISLIIQTQVRAPSPTISFAYTVQSDNYVGKTICGSFNDLFFAHLNHSEANVKPKDGNFLNNFEVIK